MIPDTVGEQEEPISLQNNAIKRFVTAVGEWFQLVIDSTRDSLLNPRHRTR